MTIKNLNGKKVRVCIKNGFNIQDFCNKYNCNEEELRARIGQLFTVPETARKVLGEIEDNNKKRRPKATTKKVATNASDAVVETVEESKEDNHHVPTLSELKESENRYSDIAIELEKSYKEYFRKRENGREKCGQLFKEIKALKEAYSGKCQAVREIIREDNEIVGKMNEIASLYHNNRAALEAIRSRIEEMSKIVICVYSDREIALLDETVEIHLDDNGHEKLFDQMREQEAAEDFRPKDLRLVARIIMIAKNLDVPVEIVFEDEEAKKAYEIFAA